MAERVASSTACLGLAAALEVVHGVRLAQRTNEEQLRGLSVQLAADAAWSLLGDTDEAERDCAALAASRCASGDPRIAMWAHELFGHLHARRSRQVESIAVVWTACEFAHGARPSARASAKRPQRAHRSPTGGRSPAF